VLPTAPLRSVYRAVDEDLVLQLSKNFYDGSLRRLPEGQSATGLDRALTVEYLPDGTGLPSADHEGVESVVAEVNRVVELVFEHARLRPRTSLAVVTASLRHAARIGESIRLQLPNYPSLSGFFTAGDESFRVVDLERAQGLVRDRVIFSPGYGRTPHGRALHSFGPLSAEGGRAKFALAMTRARESLHVLTCFKPEDLDRTRLAHGAVDLFELLDREISGNTDLGTPASRAAASEQALGADPLVADLGDRLRARGARVWHQYDGVIDVVAAADPLSTMGQDEADIPRPVAIESDGTEQYRQMTVRERSRLRPQLLERLGWRYMPLWTIEVFTDPSACADRIGGYLGLEKPAPTLRSVGAPGFFLDDDVSTLAVGDFEPDLGEEDSYQGMDGSFGDDPDGNDGGKSGWEAPDRGATEAVLADAHSPGAEQTDIDQTGADQRDVDQTGTDQAGTDQANGGGDGFDSDAAGAGVGFGSEPGLERPATERKKGQL
jgi:hypothetical protein